MRSRKRIDPTRIATPQRRDKGRRRMSDYADAEGLGMAAAALLVLAILGLTLFRLLTGRPWP